MIRYIRQVYATSCGPIAIINAVKWAGYRVPRKEYIHYYGERCDWNPKVGTENEGMNKALQNSEELEFVDFCINPKLSLLDKHLSNGNSLIVVYQHPTKSVGHFVFCPKKTKKFFYIVNMTQKITIQRIHRKTMRRILSEKGPLKLTSHSAVWAVRSKIAK